MAVPDRIYSQGDPWRPSAAQFNFWTEAARAAKGMSSGTAGIPAIAAPRNFVAVQVVNTTEDTLPHLACVAFKDPAVLPTDDEARFRYSPLMAAIAPPAADPDLYQYGILTQELAPNAVGLAMTKGVTAVRVSGTGNFATYTSTTASRLQLGSTGWKVTWKESGSSERWGVMDMSQLETTSCAEYFILRVEGGPTAGTIPWSVIDLDDNSTASSGTYTLGDAYTTIKSVIDTDLSTDCLILGGPLPGNGIVIHLNRGLSASRWRFKIGTSSLTPQAGFGCYAVVDACCVAGG